MNLNEQQKLLEKGGFSRAEITGWKQEKVKQLQQGGFTNQEISDEFKFEPDNKVIKDYVNKITKDYLAQDIVIPEDEMLYQSNLNRGKPVKQAIKDIKETVIGKEFDGDYIAEQILGTNLWNLSKRAAKGEGTPEALSMPKPEDYTWTEEFLSTLGTLAVDSPIYAGSAVVGLPAGKLGAGFTGAMIPTTTRSTLLKVLENQDEGKPSDVIKILLEETLEEGLKEGAKFSASLALPMLKIPGGKTLASNYISRTAAQITGYQGTGLILDEEIPDKGEFASTALLFSLFNIRLPKAKAEKKAKQIFVDYGKKPTDIALDSAKNRTVREDLLSDNVTIRAYEIKDSKKIEIPKEEIQVTTKPRFKDPIASKAAENISFEAKQIPITKEQIKQSIKNAAKTSKRKFIIKAIDQKYPVLEALREAKVKTKTGIEKLNTYELLRLQEGMQGRSAHFIEFGTLDFKTLADNGPSLISIVKPFVKDKTETNLLSTYLTNRHAVTLAKRGKESGVDIPNAEIFLKKYTNKKVKDPDTGKMITYEQAAKKIDTYLQDGVLKYAFDGGLITKESYNAFREINKNYMPMARELPRPGESGFIKGSNNPFKKLKGSKLKIIDPLESILKNTDYIVRMTELNKTKNDFINIILEAQKKDPLAFDWIKKKKGNLKPITVQRKELEKFFDKETLDKLSDKGVQELSIFRQEAVYPDGNSISLRNTKTGKYEVWEVGEDLVTAFRVMDNPSMNFVAKFLTAPTRTLRTGAIVTPDFALPNFFKDTMNATFLSKVTWLPIVDSIRGLFNVVFKDPKRANEAYKRFLKSGAAFSTLRSVDRRNFDAPVHQLLNKGVMRNEYSTPILGQFRYLTEISEEATRVGMSEKVYKAAKKKGLSERDALERAGYESKNLLDYSKKGTVGAFVNKGVPFFNARIQGATIAFEAARDRPKKFLAMIGIAVVLPTVGNYVANLDEDGELNKDYKELPDYIKNNKYYTKVNGRGMFFPKGFEVGTFFSNLTEKVLDYIRTNEKQEFTSYVSDFAKEHAKGYTPIPTFARPFIENLFDYSIFREAPILPPSAPKDMLNAYYSTEYTNPTLKELAENLAQIVGTDNYFANPIYLENIYDSYTGGIGRLVKESINSIAIKGGIIDDPIRPKDPLTKIPGIRVFQAKDVYGYSKSIQEFYNLTKDYKTVINTVDYLLKIGNTEGYLKEIQKVDFDVEAVIEIEDGMKQVSDDIKVIYNAKMKDDGTLFTPEEKRDLIDDLYRVRIGLAQKGVQIIKNVEQQKK
jgi:hypothetical protein|tara:strand:+ start:1106 stop:4918 length:3813 start_codon:yes stop_codon:yes gene_type:complete